jgi:hypothetical protein
LAIFFLALLAAESVIVLVAAWTPILMIGIAAGAVIFSAFSA